MNVGSLLDGVDVSRFHYETPSDDALANAVRWAQTFYFKLAEYGTGEDGNVGTECLMGSAPCAFACMKCLEAWRKNRGLGAKLPPEEFDRTFEDDAKRLEASGKYVAKVAQRITVNGVIDLLMLRPTQYLPTIRTTCESWRAEMRHRNPKQEGCR